MSAWKKLAILLLVAIIGAFIWINHEQLWDYFSGVMKFSWWNVERFKIALSIIVGLVGIAGLRTAIASHRTNQENLVQSERSRVAGTAVNWESTQPGLSEPPNFIIMNTNNYLIKIDSVHIFGYGKQNYDYDIQPFELEPGGRRQFKVPNAFWLDVCLLDSERGTRPSQLIDVIVNLRDIDNREWSRDASNSVDRGASQVSFDSCYPWSISFSVFCKRLNLSFRKLIANFRGIDDFVMAEKLPYTVDRLDPLGIARSDGEAQRGAATVGVFSIGRLAPGNFMRACSPMYLSMRDYYLASMYNLILDQSHPEGSYTFRFTYNEDLENALKDLSLADSECEFICSILDGSNPLGYAVRGDREPEELDALVSKLLNEPADSVAAAHILFLIREFSGQFVMLEGGIDQSWFFNWLCRNYSPLSESFSQRDRSRSFVTRVLLKRIEKQLGFHQSSIAELWTPDHGAGNLIPSLARLKSNSVVWWPRTGSYLNPRESSASLETLRFLNPNTIRPFKTLMCAGTDDGLFFPFPSDLSYGTRGKKDAFIQDVSRYYGFWNEKGFDGYHSGVVRFANSINFDDEVIDMTAMKNFM